LLTALSERPETERSSADRALRRRLARLGPLGRNDWRRLAILARLARTAATVDRLAIEADVNVTYLRTWIRRLLGVTAKAYRQLPAWEAVLELGLRRAGMVLHPGTG
jgi:hypothetical protein